MSFTLSARRLSLVRTATMLGASLLGAGAAQAGITYYSSQASFDAAAPGLPVDSFTGTGVTTGPYVAPGITLSTVSGGAQNLYFHDGGIAPNYFGDTLVLSLSPNDTAVSVTVDGAPASGLNGPASPLIVDVYLQGSATPVETSYSVATNTPYFLGLTSTVPITQVNLLYDYNSDAWTILTSASYGTAAPEPASIATGCLMTALLLLRRTQRAAR